MKGGTLMLHAGGQRSTRDELMALPQPVPLGVRHKPVSHIEVLEAVDQALGNWSLKKVTEAVATAKQGAQLFALMRVEPHEASALSVLANEEYGFCLGIRSATDMSLALRFAVGVHVFVCDNLAFSGEYVGGGEISETGDVMRKLHTKGLQLAPVVDEGLGKYVERTQVFVKRIEAAKMTYINNITAKEILADVFGMGIIPSRKFAEAYDIYFSPPEDAVDVQPRTLWGLHNALTRVVRTMKPGPKFTATMRLGRMLPAAA